MARKPKQQPRKSLSPYQRIMRAAERGVGVRLSASDVAAMSNDNAIATVAENDDEYTAREVGR